MGYIITEPAAADLLGIHKFIAEDDPQAADRVLNRIQAKFPKLADVPGMGRARDDLAPGLRSFPAGRHLIFYRAADKGVEILRVLHAARDIEAQFEGE